MIKKITFYALLLLYVTGFAQTDEVAPPEVYQNLTSKNYYLLHAIEKNKEIKKILEEDEILDSLSRSRYQEISSSFSDTTKLQSLNDYITPYKFTSEEIAKVSSRLEKIYVGSEKIRNFVENDLKSSGAYNLYEKGRGEEILSKAWELCANGINHVLETYGEGKPSQYASMDSVSYNVKTNYYRGAIAMWSDHLHGEINNPVFYFEPMNFARSLLYLNHRDEAARYEPLEEWENKDVFKNVQDIDFSKYPYATILILGNGPENYMDRLSALGKLNIRLGVKEYLEGKAPLIIVSGGHAHPFRAEYAEAIEMKKELIEQYNIPEDSIIIEPHARHTTTNLRNATRLMIKYKIPISHPSLVVTNPSHSEYTGSSQFIQRCLEELGYLPGVITRRMNPSTLVFQPKMESLQQNPLDPLDP